MANEVYLRKGTSKLVNGEAGADTAWSMEGVANAAGRVSAQIDWGAAPRPDEYEWSCEVQWQATPTQGAVLELYVAGAPDGDSTQIDGDVGTTDAALGDVDMRRNLKYIGCVVSENAAASEICVASSRFRFTQRYMTLVGYNGGGATINATDSNFRFNIVPIYYQDSDVILLPYSRPWEQQPQEVVPPGRLLVAAYGGLYGTEGSRWVPQGSPTVVPAPGGQAMRFAVASSQAILAPIAGVNSNNVTVFAVARKRTTELTNQALVSLSAASGSNRTLLYWSGGSNLRLSLFVGSGATFRQAQGPTLTSWTDTDSYYVIVGVVSNNQNGLACYYTKDGVETGSTITTSNTVTAAAPVSVSVGGYYNDGAYVAGFYADADILAAGVLPWAVSANERALLSRSLSAWAEYLQPQRIWVPVSAGGGINASVTLTGCSAASAAGATVALGSATAALSGASSASAAGSLLATAGATAVLSGTSSASAAGAVAASAGASVTVVGSAASSAAGALTATAGGNAVATLTGASATSTAGSLTAGGSAGISLAGVGAAGAAGAVTATAGGAASVTLTGASASAAAGILAGFGGAQITLTGASASGAAGSASASAGSGSGTGATAAEIWSYTLSSGLTAEATLVAIHTMLSELHLIHGLTAGSPLSVTAASRAAGAVSQAVAEAAGTVTVTRQ